MKKTATTLAILAVTAHASEININPQRAIKLKTKETLNIPECTIKSETINGEIKITTTPISNNQYSKNSNEDIIQKICNGTLLNHYSYEEIKQKFHPNSPEIKHLITDQAAYTKLKSESTKQTTNIEQITKLESKEIIQYLCKKSTNTSTSYCIYNFNKKTNQYLNCLGTTEPEKSPGNAQLNTLLNILQQDAIENKNSITSIKN